MHSPEKKRQVKEKDWSQEVEHMQVPNGTGPCVRRRKRLLSVRHTHRICSYSVKGRERK